MYYDGIPTDKINLDALRSNITIIPQVVGIIYVLILDVALTNTDSLSFLVVHFDKILTLSINTMMRR